MKTISEEGNAQNIGKTAYPVLFAVSAVHFLNDSIQQVIPAMYPVFKDSLGLTFAEIGLITFALNITASLLQPVIGIYTDARPTPYSLPVGVCFTLAGIVLLAFAPNFYSVLAAVATIGIGSSIFHPESSRVAYLASGTSGKRGLAQSVFQVGGNAGSALAPLLAAAFIVPRGQTGMIGMVLFAIVALLLQLKVSAWYKNYLQEIGKASRKVSQAVGGLSKGKVTMALFILVILLFSKYVYVASITSYYTFYLIERFHVSVEQSQFYLFLFLLATAVGTFLGGPLGDKFGRKYVIWFSILGTAPFSIMLPYANLFWSSVLCIMIGLILASAFSAILVYAQELMPGKVGMISGLFFGLAFGIGGLGSAVLGYVADRSSIETVLSITAFLPLLGIAAGFLPELKKK